MIINWTDPVLRVHHSLMSASGAAPLPRLGEVFFDVRGSSRSMRLSWYADTGIAVFSIWQGGMCTGTFRLPIGDLTRMIEILQRGPEDLEPPRRRRERRSGQGRRDHDAGHATSRVVRTGAVLYDDDEGEAAAPVHDSDDAPARARRGYGSEQPNAIHDSRHLRSEATGESWSADGSADEGDEESWPAYGSGDDAADGSWSEYGPDRYLPEQADGAYVHDVFPADSPAEYGRSRYDYSESAGQGPDDEGDAVTGGYRSERFVPRYVHGDPREYTDDIPPRGADVLGKPRRSAYPEDLPRGRSQPADYDRERWPEDRYSDEPDYRLPNRHAGSGDGSRGRHSAG